MNGVEVERRPDLEVRAARKIEDGLLISLEGDIDEEGRFGHRTLEVTGNSVRVLQPGGAISLNMPISEVKSARNEPLVGGGRLEITAKTSEILPIISYSLTRAPLFSEAARGIEQLARGEELCINLKQERLRCAKCDRLLPEKDGVCPACVNRRKTLWRILQFLKPYRWRVAALASVGVLATANNLIPPILQGKIIDSVLTTHRNLNALFLYVGMWLGVVIVATALQITNGRLIAFLAGHVAADLRARLYRAIEFLQVSYFDKKQVGAIASRVTQDTDRVWGFLVDGLPYVVSNGLLLVGIMAFLFLTNGKLAVCVLSPVPVVVLISALFWRPISQMFYRVGQKWARFHMHLTESLTGIRVVKAFAQEDYENSKFTKRNAELRESGVAVDSRWYTIFGAMTFFTALGQLINWLVGGWMVYRGEITLGDFVKVNSLIMLVYGPIQWFGELNQWFSRAMGGAERIFEVMDTVKEDYGSQEAGGSRREAVKKGRGRAVISDQLSVISDSKTRKAQYPTPNTQNPIHGEVSFNGVRFGYDKSNPVLKGLTFTAKPGEMIGLVGKSGAGKSTTINLICRFYEPDAGTLAIDGMDYRDIPLQEMRRQIGIVLQEPFLFNGTIAENISYGKPGASFCEIVEASRAANAHNFILGKPDGYDTIVGEKGSKLSGGERQRVSIARAILHDPRILILDEATSSVDVETEKQIQEAIGRLVAGRTTFAIAHRLSTLRNATRLIVLEKGEIVEMGTHAELMERKGEFYKLVETQSQVTQIIGIAG